MRLTKDPVLELFDYITREDDRLLKKHGAFLTSLHDGNIRLGKNRR